MYSVGCNLKTHLTLQMPLNPAHGTLKVPVKQKVLIMQDGIFQNNMYFHIVIIVIALNQHYVEIGTLCDLVSKVVVVNVVQ